MRETGLFRAIQTLGREGTPVAGICGGYQMMGESLRDPLGVEGPEGEEKGLGFLPLTTEFSNNKRTLRCEGTLTGQSGFLKDLKDMPLRGYEIHMGESYLSGNTPPLYRRRDGSFDGAVSGDGKFWGSYMHGIFDNMPFRRAFLMSLGWEAAEPGESEEVLREKEFERIADAVEEAVDMDALDRIIGLKGDKKA